MDAKDFIEALTIETLTETMTGSGLELKTGGDWERTYHEARKLATDGDFEKAARKFLRLAKLSGAAWLEQMRLAADPTLKRCAYCKKLLLGDPELVCLRKPNAPEELFHTDCYHSMVRF